MVSFARVRMNLTTRTGFDKAKFMVIYHPLQQFIKSEQRKKEKEEHANYLFIAHTNFQKKKNNSFPQPVTFVNVINVIIAPIY